MAVEIELVGGPADAKRIVVDADPMSPPKSIELDGMPPVDWSAPAEEQVPFRKLRYVRAVNPLDEGPLWHYRYDGPEA